MKISRYFTLILFVLLFSHPQIVAEDATPKQPANGYPDFALGADVSWYSRINALDKANLTFYKSSSSSETWTQAEIIDYYGLDAIRLRVWVDPDGDLVKGGWKVTIGSSTDEYMVNTLGYNDKEDVLKIAKELSAYGYRFLIDFHLSDTWCDPARQFVPKAWSSCTTVDQMAVKVSDHITDVLSTLRDANINVQWVQVGNELRTGFLKYALPSATGATAAAGNVDCGFSSSDYSNFSTVYKAGAKAAKTIYPEAKLVFHSPDGCNSSATSTSTKLGWTLAVMKNAGLMSGTFTLNGNTYNYIDLVGLSVYPLDSDDTASWKTNIDYMIQNVADIYSTYGKNTLICEFGMNNDYSTSGGSTQSTYITQCNTDVSACTTYILNALKSNSHCEGLFYWEPFCDHLSSGIDGDGGYKLSAVYDIEGNWARTKVAPNAWWDVIKSNSTFPDGGLVDFTITNSGSEGNDEDDEGDDNEDPTPAESKVYMCATGISPVNPTELTYDESTGLFSGTVTTYADYENTWWIALSTQKSTSKGEDENGYDAGNGEFEAASLYPTGTVKNGETIALDGTGEWFKLPYAATWTITVNLEKKTVNCYTTTKSDDTSVDTSSFTTVNLYSGKESTWESTQMTSEDGNSYYCSITPSDSWLNFRFYTGDWENQYSTGAVADKDTEYDLLTYFQGGDAPSSESTSTGWQTWLNNFSTTESIYFWFNLSELKMKITSSSTSPWDLNLPTTYTIYFNNENAQWPSVYAYVKDEEGNELCGAWPGKHMDYGSSTASAPGYAAASANNLWNLDVTTFSTPKTISFSNGAASVSSDTEDFVNNKTYEYSSVITGIDNVSMPEVRSGKVWYNLQGMPVLNPIPGKVYILRENGKTTKILAR